MKAIDRLYIYLAEYNLKPTVIEKAIGLSNGYLSAQKKRNADMGEGIINKVIDYCQELNPEWLLTGQGSMLRSKQNQTTPQLIDQQNTSSESTAYQNMYKAEREENKRLNDKIAQMSIEIGMLKAQQNQVEQKEFQGLEKGKRSPNVKAASLKKDLSKQIQSADSANAQLEVIKP